MPGLSSGCLTSFADPECLELMALNLEPMVARYAIDLLLQLVIIDLDNISAPNTDQVFMMCNPEIDFIVCMGLVQVNTTNEPAFLQMSDRAIQSRPADTKVLAAEFGDEVINSEMGPISEYLLKNNSSLGGI